MQFEIYPGGSIKVGMLLHSTIDLKELNELPRFDFLVGVVAKIRRVDELHASEEDDSNYTFVIWLKNLEKVEEVYNIITKNIEANLDLCWSTEAFYIESGMVIVSSTLIC